MGNNIDGKQSGVSFTGRCEANIGVNDILTRDKIYSANKSGLNLVGKLNAPTNYGNVFAEGCVTIGLSCGAGIKAGYEYNIDDNKCLEFSAQASTFVPSGNRSVTTEVTLPNKETLDVVSNNQITTFSGYAGYSKTLDNGLKLSAGIEGGVNKGIPKSTVISDEETANELTTAVKNETQPTLDKKTAGFITPKLSAEMPIKSDWQKISVYMDVSANDIQGGMRWYF